MFQLSEEKISPLDETVPAQICKTLMAVIWNNHVAKPLHLIIFHRPYIQPLKHPAMPFNQVIYVSDIIKLSESRLRVIQFGKAKNVKELLI